MKPLTILIQADKSTAKEITKKTKTRKLFKIILGVFMLSWILLMSSCLVGSPRYGGPSGYPGNHENRGNNGHHGDHDDNGNHNNNNPHNK